MIQVFLLLWIVSAVLAVKESKIVRIVIYLAVFTLLSSICFFMLAAPDVAMAEIAVTAFTTVFFIICLEKHFEFGADAADSANGGVSNGKLFDRGRIRHIPGKDIFRAILLAAFAIGLFVLFVMFIPDNPANNFLRDLYIERFQSDIGGQNAVTSIYLGYRVYDTLFEALMLLISVVAVAHLSWYQSARDKVRDHINSKFALPIIRVASPFMLLFGVYLTVNGHLSPGGGFQGGVVIAAFFICRYLILDISDIRVGRFITVEKLVYFAIALLAVLFVFTGIGDLLSLEQGVYLVSMNLLIGMKVSLGFIIILYRYIAFERR